MVRLSTVLILGGIVLLFVPVPIPPPFLTSALGLLSILLGILLRVLGL